MQGPETLWVEQFTRTPSTITGDLRLLSQHARTRYTLRLRPDGTPERADVADERPNVRDSIRYVFGPTSISESGTKDGYGFDTDTPGSANTYAWIGTSFALIEQLLRAIHPAVGDSLLILAVNIRQAGDAGPVLIKRLTPDSVRINQHTYVTISPTWDILRGVNDAAHWQVTRR
jgi:hypothetical protein